MNNVSVLYLGMYGLESVCSLFNDVFSISDCIASNERMMVNNELERMRKEAVVA
jgi:hypothetical protein